jgi:hypothetical protein
MKLKDLLSQEEKELLNQSVQKKKRKRKRKRRKPQPEIQRLPDDLPVVLEITEEERREMEFERMMRGDAWRRVNGSIKQIRHK